MTRTFAVLQVSARTFEELERKLREAGYDHAFVDDAKWGPLVDMHGIALAAEPPGRES